MLEVLMSVSSFRDHINFAPIWGIGYHHVCYQVKCVSIQMGKTIKKTCDTACLTQGQVIISQV